MEHTKTSQAGERTRFITFTEDCGCTVQCWTEAEYKANGGLPEKWDDYIWQFADSKESAIARHDDALDTYNENINTGRTTKETY